MSRGRRRIEDVRHFLLRLWSFVYSPTAIFWNIVHRNGVSPPGYLWCHFSQWLPKHGHFLNRMGSRVPVKCCSLLLHAVTSGDLPRELLSARYINAASLGWHDAVMHPDNFLLKCTFAWHVNMRVSIHIPHDIPVYIACDFLIGLNRGQATTLITENMELNKQKYLGFSLLKYYLIYYINCENHYIY